MKKPIVPYQFISFLIICAMIISAASGYLGYKVGAKVVSERFNDYKSHSLDLAAPYIGIKPTTFQYLYSLKQGIFHSGKAQVVLLGRVIDFGANGTIAFRIHLRHVTDTFVNTITPDYYKDAVVTAVYSPSGRTEQLSLSDIHRGDEIELAFTMDLLTAEETVTSITVHRTDQ